jgi:hypothetical protein
MHFEMDAYGSWYMEEPNVDEKEWASTLTPWVCLIFMKEPVGKIWGIMNLNLVVSY